MAKYQKAVAVIVVLILVVTVLEFPPPIGFEPRPQDNVSLGWLGLFLAILVSEIAAMPLIFKRPALGAKLGILAAVLNILQIFADQLHLMQPEIAPWYYLAMEDVVGVLSLALAYFSWKVLMHKNTFATGVVN